MKFIRKLFFKFWFKHSSIILAKPPTFKERISYFLRRIPVAWLVKIKIEPKPTKLLEGWTTEKDITVPPSDFVIKSMTRQINPLDKQK